VTDHFSKIEEEGEEKPKESPINDFFPYEFLYAIEITTTPCYANIVNYLVCGILPSGFSYQMKEKFISDSKVLPIGRPFALQTLC